MKTIPNKNEEEKKPKKAKVNKNETCQDVKNYKVDQHDYNNYNQSVLIAFLSMFGIYVSFLEGKYLRINEIRIKDIILLSWDQVKEEVLKQKNDKNDNYTMYSIRFFINWIVFALRTKDFIIEQSKPKTSIKEEDKQIVNDNLFNGENRIRSRQINSIMYREIVLPKRDTVLEVGKYLYDNYIKGRDDNRELKQFLDENPNFFGEYEKYL